MRQLYNDVGEIIVNRRYDPFGNSWSTSGSGSSVYGFAGEQYDTSTGLVFLRARYYAPGQGRFITRDLWPGDMRRPWSLNQWNYVGGNPVSFVDRTGYFPTEADILKGDAEFTCQCGWIDWNHVDKSDELGYALMDDLAYARYHYYPHPVLSDNWGIYIGIPLGDMWGLQLDLFGGVAVIPNSHLSGRIELAVSVFMDANERFEEIQGQLGWLPIFGPRLRSSYYSEEDLPSDIVGFYIGSQRFGTELSSEQIKQQIREACGAVGKQESLNVFRETYDNGAKAITNWRYWYARLLPLTGCNANLCVGMRTWPSEFVALTAARIYPCPDGIWWWYRGWSTDGNLVPIDRPRVFRLSADLRLPLPP